METNKLSIGFIGAGTVGTALAIILGEKGYRFVGASRRSSAGPNVHGTPVSNFRILPDNQSVADAADLVFITTPDDAIASVAREVRWRAGQSVVHCSGADSTCDQLRPCGPPSHPRRRNQARSPSPIASMTPHTAG